MKKIIVIAVVVLAAASSWFVYRIIPKEGCPDLLVQNRFPTIIENTSQSAEERDYYIFNGERRSVSQEQESWIKWNCSVKVETVS